MNREEAHNLITKFVTSHPGCTGEQIVVGLNEQMSRVPLFRLLGEMTAQNVLKDEKKNRRDHHYIVNGANPLNLLKQELDEFENALVAYVRYAKEKYDNGIQLAMKEYDSKGISNGFGEMDDLKGRVQLPIIEFFSHVISTYSSYAFFKWPMEIKDKELLEQMYATLFQKLNQIASHLSESMEWAKRGEPYRDFEHDFDYDRFVEIKEHLGDVGLDETKEYEAIMNIIWKISSHILPDYVQKKGWKKALENVRKTGVP